MAVTSAMTRGALPPASIKILSGREGYSTWKFKMKAYLLHEKLWNAVQGYPEGDNMFLI